MIDSHCHLDVSLFDADRDAVLSRAAAVGVEALIVPAVDEPSWTAIAALAKTGSTPRIHAALGIHPVALPEMSPEDDARLIASLRTHVERLRPVAIGECGLDTTVDLTRAPMERQEAVLAAQLELACRFDLPVVLHARGPDCYSRLLAFLRTATMPARGGVLHSYGGGHELLKQYLELPLMFSFAGPATYARATKVRKAIAAVPDDRLLAETDAPDQCPEPHRPGRSEPAYVANVIDGIAAARGATAEAIAKLTTANARRLFAL